MLAVEQATETCLVRGGNGGSVVVKMCAGRLMIQCFKTCESAMCLRCAYVCV